MVVGNQASADPCSQVKVSPVEFLPCKVDICRHLYPLASPRHLSAGLRGMSLDFESPWYTLRYIQPPRGHILQIDRKRYCTVTISISPERGAQSLCLPLI
jgi:hypothetical protein